MYIVHRFSWSVQPLPAFLWLVAKIMTSDSHQTKSIMMITVIAHAACTIGDNKQHSRRREGGKRKGL